MPPFPVSAVVGSVRWQETALPHRIRLDGDLEFQVFGIGNPFSLAIETADNKSLLRLNHATRGPGPSLHE